MLLSKYLIEIGSLAVSAGCLGALTGIGGGIVLIPLLTTFFHIPLYQAMGASLLCVLVNSSLSGGLYIKQGLCNLKIGIFLEIATVIGAIVGAWLIPYVPIKFILFCLSLILFMTSISSWRRKENNEIHLPSHPLSAYLQLEGTFTLPSGEVKSYTVPRSPAGFMAMFIAGITAGLLGIGAGTLKVLAMDQIMRLPYRVSTTTSNFIIGITATASAGIYFVRGYFNPLLTFAIIPGVLLGTWLGTVLLLRIKPEILRKIFSSLIFIFGCQMLWKVFL